ncbi:hypothetical protein NC653_004203 [Populus alba x Populus x berolinensis]|uniref:Uncharacterized protein n=1 Tax=Populus alba x Populus x berolinensis TaxID=444605 RepID=A0AAD6WJN1_9ROSI|nr:hypothetical protein NC653_004203 [Populus alba x Populus x berolinensis]
MQLKTVVWYWKFLSIIIMIRGVISSMFQLPLTFELWKYRNLINSEYNVRSPAGRQCELLLTFWIKRGHFLAII